MNIAVPNGDSGMLIWQAVPAGCDCAEHPVRLDPLRYMTVVGQEIIYDIRKDLFEHLQRLSFQFYDDRPHGKILTRVINYVNSVSDALSNGIINFILEKFST